MEGRGIYLRVGALVVLATVVAVGLILFLGGARLSNGREYESYFRESVQGLEVGAAVKYRGVTLGQVSEISLVSAVYGGGEANSSDNPLYRQVLVRYLLDLAKLGPGGASAIQNLIAQGMRARLTSQGLTGLTYIELDIAPPGRFPIEQVPWTPRFANIPSMPSTLTQVQDAAQVLISKLDRVDITGLSDNLVGLLQDLRATLRDGQLHAVLGNMQSLLATTEGEVKAANLPALTGELRDTAASLRNVAQGRNTTELIANANLATQRLAAATAQLPALLESIDRLTRRAGNGTEDIQVQLDPVLRDVRAAAANLRDTTEQLRRDPSQLLFSAPPPRGRDAR